MLRQGAAMPDDHIDAYLATSAAEYRRLVAPVSDQDCAMLKAAAISIGREYTGVVRAITLSTGMGGFVTWNPLAIMGHAIEIAMYHGMALETQTKEGGCSATTRLNGRVVTYLENGNDRELDLMRAIVRCAVGILAEAPPGGIGRRTMTVGESATDQTVNASPTSSPASPSP
jgi:hypothetical protein